MIIFMMQFAILRVFCTSLHATPQALGCLLGTTNNMGTKNMIKKQCSSTRLMSPVRAKVEINFKFKLLYLPSGGDRPSDRRRDTADWRKPPENKFCTGCRKLFYTGSENNVCTCCENKVYTRSQNKACIRYENKAYIRMKKLFCTR